MAETSVLVLTSPTAAFFQKDSRTENGPAGMLFDLCIPLPWHENKLATSTAFDDCEGARHSRSVVVSLSFVRVGALQPEVTHNLLSGLVELTTLEVEAMHNLSMEVVLSEIEWTDTTWNPVAGCTAASSGCTNCYAMHMALRLEAMGMPKYQGLARRSGNRTVWTGAVNLDEKSLEAPLRWRKPRKVFVNSMSDLFHERVPFEFVEKVWRTMERTPHHQYQILTKRPERMLEFTSNHLTIVLPNVWLGTSVENAETADRIVALAKTPAAIRFISFEPLIAPVGNVDLRGIHWAIVGGESGAQARPIKEEWIDEIHSLCKRHGTAFFFKQWGTWGKDNKKRSKKANGRLFRGKVWEEMPTISAMP